MQSTGVKIIEAQQAKFCKDYKHTKLKLLKKNAAIWFKKMCKTKQLNPKYFSIKINGNNRQSRNIRMSVYKIIQDVW